MEFLEELKSSESFLYFIWAYFIAINLISYGAMWLNIPYRKKYKKQIHWIIFVILNFVGGCFGILFSIDKVKYKKGEGIILFTTYLALLGCWLFGVNYLI